LDDDARNASFRAIGAAVREKTAKNCGESKVRFSRAATIVIFAEHLDYYLGLVYEEYRITAWSCRRSDRTHCGWVQDYYICIGIRE
jgi:hypothetical protein